MMLDHQNKTTGGHITYTHYHQNKTAGGHITTLIHIITRTRLQEDISLHLYTLSPEQDCRRTYRYTYTHYHQNKTTGGHIATLIHIITRTRLQEDISLIHIILILIKPVFAIIPYWEKTILFLYSLIWNQRSTALEANMLAIIQTTWYHHTCTYSTKIVTNYGGCLWYRGRKLIEIPDHIVIS
jgi:hypothetical protein